VRNEIRLHAFVPVTTYTWVNFWEANNPRATGEFRLPETWIGKAEVRRIRALPEVEQDAVWRRLAFKWIASNPGKAMEGWVRDARLFATGSDYYATSVYAIHGVHVPRLDDRWLVLAGYISVILLLVLGWRRLAPFGIPILTIAYFVAFFSVFIASARFRVPILPLLVVFAAGLPDLVRDTLKKFWRSGKDRKRGLLRTAPRQNEEPPAAPSEGDSAYSQA
jgi:hypothetical protein